MHDGRGRLVGLVDDVLVGSVDEPYPPVVALLVRTARGRAFVPVQAISDFGPTDVRLAGELDGHSAKRPSGLVALAHDVLDRQIVDVDGANVDRVSDLILGRTEDGYRLVGVDVSILTLIRRLGPRSLRRRVSPERVHDWTSVGAFSERGADGAPSVLRLTSSAAELRKRNRGEVADVLADLPPHEQAQLASAEASA